MSDMKKTSVMILALSLSACLLSGCADPAADAAQADEEPVSSVSWPTDGSLSAASGNEEPVSGDDAGETDDGAYPPSVMIDGVVYKDTGYVDSMSGCGVMDGEIRSSVDGRQLPAEDDQSNFGTGYEYQRSSEGQVMVEIDGERRIFREIGYEGDDMPEQVMNFDAEVKEVMEDGTLLVTYVRVADGFGPMSAGDYTVSAENLRDEVQAGDLVRIWSNGSVMETYPAQIGNAYRIEKVTEQP